ncbi:MAG: DUF2807 domain-containing protein [Ferruginibacter sp.]|nr:DUF2807 domain-containing protein [Ferruginibacter sp.]
MKNTILFTLLLFCLASCSQNKKIAGRSPMRTELRSVGTFSRITYSGDGEVTIVKSDVFKVEVSDYENLLPYLETEVTESDKLKIEYRAGMTIRNTKLKVTIHMPMTTEVVLRGNGKISLSIQNATPGKLNLSVLGDGTISSGAVKTADLSVNIGGNGRISILDADAERAVCTIKGDGDIQIQNGNISTSDFSINGNAKIDMCKVSAKKAVMEMTGDGIITSRVSDSVTASIIGNAIIYVVGKPEINEKKMVGNGKIKKLETCSQ